MVVLTLSGTGELFVPSHGRINHEVFVVSRPDPARVDPARNSWGASAIQCGYAAARRGTVESTNTSAIKFEENGLVGDRKISRPVRGLFAKPACLAGARISWPNFSALYGLEKL